MKHKFLIHGVEDQVGVAVEDFKAEEEVMGVFLDTNGEIVIKSNHDICLGHKISIAEIKSGDSVYEYGEIIGKATENIQIGDWVHIHNIKTARW